MSSETRTIRPYVGGQEFQSVLDSTRLQIGDRMVDGGGRVSVSLDEYLNFPFNLVLADNDHDLHEIQADIADGLAGLGLATSDVEFLVLASAPRLKMVDIVKRVPLDEFPEIPRVVEITNGGRPRPLRAPNGGCDLRVYFCLSRWLPAKPLQPWRKGTWLGKQDFAIRSELTGTGFLPVRLDDDMRRDLGLHPNTVRYTTLDENQSAFEGDVPPDAVRVYVDAELLDRLGVNAKTPVGRQLQRQMFLDAVGAVVNAAIKELHTDQGLAGADIDEFNGSLVHALVEMIAGRAKTADGQKARNDAFRLLRDDPQRFIARVDAEVGTRRDMLELFED